MTENSPDPGNTSERSRFFGRSKGKKLRDTQAAVFADLLPQLLITLGPERVDLAGLFPFKPQGYRLEIGFGGGEHLLKRAIESPETGFIGCEPFVNGMAKLLMEIDRLKLVNIRVFNNDAFLLLKRLPPACLDAVDLLYPDPWPKRRQRKRRFVSGESLGLLADAVKPGGLFRFASDIDDYVGWTLARVLAAPAWQWPAMNVQEWTTPYEGWVQTRYEAKAFREGRVPAYLTFVRTGALLPE
jgi:tRNA (guanine-N7-)-methyltransferase